MLAAMEDLLDSFPGTLLVVSHDRYLLERITDQQYAVLGGHFRHLPGGVDEYLKVRQSADASASKSSGGGKPAAKPSGLGGAELRNAQKELASVNRRLEKAGEKIAAVHARMAEHDQNDYTGLGALSEELLALDAQTAELESRWLELTTALES